MSTFWRSLEEIAGPEAVCAEWLRWVEPNFGAIRTNFLRRREGRALVVPCPKFCGCDHDVVDHGNGALVGVCTCEPWKCENIALTPAEVEVWELDWQRFGRAVAKAFGCEPRDGELIAQGSVEIGVLASGRPVVLTIQQSRDELRSAIGMIVARLREDFVVLAPTARFFDATCHGALRSAKARIVSLESSVEIGPDGGLVAEISLQSLVSGNGSVGGDTVASSDKRIALGPLKYLPGFEDVWLGDEHYNLRKWKKAQLCLQFLIERKAFDAKSAVHLDLEIDPFVRSGSGLPPAPNSEVKIHHYFNDKGPLRELCRQVVQAAGHRRYFLNTD